ncbi:MAG: efflux RND transporter periplasmic adaptor subunit [Pirellulales bacterium]
MIDPLPRPLTRQVLALRAAVGLILAALATSGCHRSPSDVAHGAAGASGAAKAPGGPGAGAPMPPPVVEVALPLQLELAETREYTGHLAAVEEVAVRARVRGELLQIHFQEGMEVEQGALLYDIDPAEFEAAVAERTAETQRLEHELQMAQSDVDRAWELYQRNAVSKEAWELKQTTLKVQQAELLKARAALKQAELNLSYTKIHAPIAGRVGRTMVTKGNLVGYNEPTLLTTIIKMDPVYVYFEIPERDLLRFEAVHQNGTSSWSLLDAPLAVGLETEDGYPHPGQVNFRDNQVESATGTVLIRGTLENSQRQLVPGLFARIQVPVGQAQKRLLVPETALAADQRGRYVLVVDADHKVAQRRIVIARNLEYPRYLAIEDGLAPTDEVIVTGTQKARPGAIVNPQQVTPEKAAAQKTAPQTIVPPATGSASAPPSDSGTNKPAETSPANR